MQSDAVRIMVAFGSPSILEESFEFQPGRVFINRHNICEFTQLLFSLRIESTVQNVIPARHLALATLRRIYFIYDLDNLDVGAAPECMVCRFDIAIIAECINHPVSLSFSTLRWVALVLV